MLKIVVMLGILQPQSHINFPKRKKGVKVVRETVDRDLYLHWAWNLIYCQK